MSYIIVADEAERERRFENRLNAIVRRCRIGKVTSKRAALQPGIIPILPPWPFQQYPWWELPHSPTIATPGTSLVWTGDPPPPRMVTT